MVARERFDDLDADARAWLECEDGLEMDRLITWNSKPDVRTPKWSRVDGQRDASSMRSRP